jgi:hypothetical protein
MTMNNSPWHCLELISGGSAPLEEWRNCLDADYEAFYGFFLEPDEPKILALGKQQQMEASGRLRLNWNSLSAALCRIFNLQRRFIEMPIPGTRQVGSWSAEAVPVILTIQNESRMFRHVICELGLRLRAPFILLGPTSSFVDAACRELLANAQAGYFSLSAHALFENGVLRCCKAPGELFQQFTAQPKKALDEDTAHKAFALVKSLEHKRTMKHPSPVSVFGFYCIDGLSVSAIARRCQCSRGTIINRLHYIRKKTGADPNTIRQLSATFGNSTQLSDSRARYIHPRSLIEQVDLDDREDE